MIVTTHPSRIYSGINIGFTTVTWWFTWFEFFKLLGWNPNSDHFQFWEIREVRTSGCPWWGGWCSIFVMFHVYLEWSTDGQEFRNGLKSVIIHKSGFAINTGWWFGFFIFSRYWEESSQLNNIFQRGWNHQPEQFEKDLATKIGSNFAENLWPWDDSDGMVSSMVVWNQPTMLPSGKLT